MKLILISNRLPISFKRQPNGKIQSAFTPGGLAIGLDSYIKNLETKDPQTKLKTVWVGWPGAEDFTEAQITKVSLELERKGFWPIFLNREQIEKFYLGFCNNTLWPLFHYFPRLVSYEQQNWQAYKEVNELFFNEIKKNYEPDSVFWIHDFQLMLLPRLIREGLKEHRPIGFFLHIPFPTFEVFRLLPKKWREDILLGLLGADLVAFHTYDYAQYFTACVRRILGFETAMDSVILPSGRRVKVEVFPMGINYEKYHNASLLPEVQKQVAQIKKHAQVEKIIFSADRLDYTKGILNRLNAFEIFLKKYPAWHGKTQLVMVVAPNRSGLLSFDEMKQRIDETVGKINGQFGKVDWTPVLYHFRTFGFEEILAHYITAEVALITPLRDGMNLVAKEYLASKKDYTGNLILSEMAGAAQELGEALTVNPNHTEEIADAIYEALNTPLEEQVEKNRLMHSRLKSYSLKRWAEDFLTSLNRGFEDTQKQYKEQSLTILNKDKILQNFRRARSKILFLDYDGTLAPYFKYPYQARPSKELLGLLKKLANLPSTRVILISGRDRATLDSWFNINKLTLIAEHGMFIKNPKQGVWQQTAEAENDWRNTVLPIMKNFANRLPGSFIEEKEYSLAWHFRLSSPELAAARSKELIENLKTLSLNTAWQINSGNKIVEAKSIYAQKGVVSEIFLKNQKYGFILAAGDDSTDEDMFKQMPNRSHTIKVGIGETAAKYRVSSTHEIISLLNKLAGE